jgi:hypothetical protein
VAPGTVERVRAVLRNVLTAAVEGGALATNPVAGIRLPRTMRGEEPVFLTPSQIETLAEDSSPFVPSISHDFRGTFVARGPRGTETGYPGHVPQTL